MKKEINRQPTKEELEQQAAQIHQKNKELALAEINAVLEKYRVKLVSKITIIGDKIGTEIMVD